MKKLVALFLALGLLLACVPVLADAPVIDVLFAETPIDVPIDGSEYHIDVSYGGSAYDIYYFWSGADGELLVDNSKNGVTTGDHWYFLPLGGAFDLNVWRDRVVVPFVCYVTGDFGKQAVDFYATYYATGDGEFVRLSLNPWEMTENGLVEVELGDGERFIDLKKEEINSILNNGGRNPLKHTWYPHNTICVDGIAFRDVRPELTGKWYNFAALDLSQDGVQRFDLVAGNLYVIGYVTVSVAGDEVVVNWQLNRQGTNDSNFKPENEFLTIFSDLDAVTDVNPATFEGPTYEFGQAISIENDLGGDTNVLLYICNQATFCNNLSYKYQNPIYHTRYWRNLSWRVAKRDAMMNLVNADLAE